MKKKGFVPAYRLGLKNCLTPSEDVMQKWLWLRAVEWCGFPFFVTQPIVPVLFIFFPVLKVLIGLYLVGFLWTFVRYSFVNVFLANNASIFVARLKWPACIGSFIYLVVHKQWFPALLSLLWPFLAGLIIIPGKVGIIELSFARKIGYVEEE
ncbi:MAG: hypothetical protein M0Z75_08590 [Nitrospiraceae bacterium]|nr:hypothetical protein [Nitrospiraceae bacterium]